MNKIFIISGPSGIGKNTIIKGLRAKQELNLAVAKTYTTRNKRESDKLEQNHIFINKDEFKNLETSGEIPESNFYNNNWYGSSKSEIEVILANNRNIITDIDVNGALAYKKLFENAVLIFIESDIRDLKNRLIKRGQNSQEEIEERLKTAKKELEYKEKYDYVVENPEGYPEKAVEEIEEIIKHEIEN